MGAWGSGPFENDDALDWMAEFEAEGVSAIEAAFANVEASAAMGFIEAPEASMAIAAAEIVAAAHGNPMSFRSGDAGIMDRKILGQALERQGNEVAAAGDLPKAAIEALNAVSRVPEQSELLMLWSEADPEFLAAFKKSLEDLNARLEKAL